MLAYLCSRDDGVTRLDWDSQSWAAHTVLGGVSASCVATAAAGSWWGPRATAPD